MNTRQAFIATNKRLYGLHYQAGIAEKFVPVNVGGHPNDAAADEFPDALFKTVNNVANLIEVIFDRSF